MSVSWQSETPPDPVQIDPVGWCLIALRLPVLAVLMIGALAIFLLVRLIERPLCGQNRPVTPFITQAVCKTALRIIGLRFRAVGTPMTEPGAVVANHSTWLDIFTLNALNRIYFVSKAEVAGWAGIGFLARVTGTLFIERNRQKAREHASVFESRLLVGHKLLFFPEGTSTDGQRVLPFKTTLFAPFMTPALKESLSIQPVSVIYSTAPGQPARFYGWWGDMDFGPSLLKLLSTGCHGQVVVIFHPPLRVADFADRKALAAAAETIVRDEFEQRKTVDRLFLR